MSRDKISDIVILNNELLDYDFGKLLTIDMSWSRYSTYLDCNAKYKLKYIEGFKEDTNIPLAMGKAIHETLESIVKYNTTDELEATGFYLSAIEKNKQDLILGTNEIEEGKTQVINALSKMETITNGNIKNVKGIETGFRYIIGRALFVGFIDLILLDEDEEGPFINVIDYKSGKTKYKTKKHGQMKLYTLAVRRMFPEMRVKASLYWTRYGEIDTYEFSKEELDEFEAEVNNNIEILVDDQYFKPNGAFIKCVYCPFSNKETCPRGNANRIIMDKAKRKREAKANG